MRTIKQNSAWFISDKHPLYEADKEHHWATADCFSFFGSI